MDNIIQDFAEDFIRHIEKYVDNLFEGEKKDISELIEIMQQDMDKTLITQFGEIKYQRIYYASKNTEETNYTYLVDDIFGIERYQRLDKGLELDLVKKAEEYSYQKATDMASKVVPLSKQTTLNTIKKLGKIDNRATDEKLEDEEKKKLKYLYIEADEDHISIQKKNRDEEENDKSESKVTKLVYVHEGREGARNKLKNAKFFSGIYNKSEDLWEEVLSYIDDSYDMDHIETIFLAGDGAPWIKNGLKEIHKSKYILDRYHLNKYVIMATGHCPKKRSNLWLGLNQADYKLVRLTFKSISEKAENGDQKERVKEARNYIYSNWAGIENYANDPNAEGCSAEGHVSHVLASRMSSRPLSWSEDGADRMARLRAFKYNGGKKDDLFKLYEHKEKEKRIKMRTEKIIDHRKTLFPVAKETVPALRKGKVNGLQRAIKSLAF